VRGRRHEPRQRSDQWMSNVPRHPRQRYKR
jgi:hypothetical protein